MTKQRRRSDPDVVIAIEALLIDGWPPRRVLAQLEADERYRGRLPTQRTIESMQADLRPVRNGPGWTMATADPNDAALVLPVLAAVTRNSEGRLGHFTVATAAWIARIRRVVPSLDPITAYRWAVRYQTASAAGRDTRELDRQLALDAEKPPRQVDPDEAAD